MSEIVAGPAIGALIGFLIGLAIAAWSRDGIWPIVWAWLIVGSALVGMLGGIVEATK